MVDYKEMSFRHIVVDGSNIATEGRSLPSLAQLDEAVREFNREFPDADLTVVVDATFAHRIDESERPAFEEAEEHAEVVSPPAGAIGRGDAFLLRIAERTGATVLSNDSFQEFHAEHDWLFDDSRLIGGKPVPGVGWIFTPRTPVRGAKSRATTRKADRRRGPTRASKEASQPMPVPKAPPPRPRATPPRPGRTAAAEDGGAVREAIAEATEEVVSPVSPASRRRRRRSSPPADPLNDPLTFITFIAEHPLGSEVEGEVESFTSHGAFVAVGSTRCYVPLAGLGEPAPRSARSVVHRGEVRTFVLQALDAQRRGVELALPDFAQVKGAPSEETVEAEVSVTKAAGRRSPAEGPAAEAGPALVAAPGTAPPRRVPAQKAAAKKTAAAKKATGAKAGASAKKAAATERGASAEKAAGTGKAVGKKAASAGKAAPKKAAAKRATLSKAPSTEKAAAKNAAPRRAAPKKAAPKKAAPKKAAPKKAAAKRATLSKAASAEEAPARRAAAKRAATGDQAVAHDADAHDADAHDADAHDADGHDADADKAPARRGAVRKAAPRRRTPAPNGQG